MIMAIHKELSLIFVCGTLLAGTVFAQSVSKETYDFNYIGQPLSDPVMQHSKMSEPKMRTTMVRTPTPPADTPTGALVFTASMMLLSP